MSNHEFPLDFMGNYRARAFFPFFKKDLQIANNQLKELLKDLGFGLLTSLPFSPITIPFILKLSKRYNVDIIPEWFKDSMK